MGFETLVPDADVLLELPPEDLAGYLLRYLVAKGGKHSRGDIGTADMVSGYPAGLRNACAQALMEAWQSLLSQGLLVPDPANAHPVYVVSRRGKALADQQKYADFQKSSLFPRASIHPEIASTFSLFLRGEYETAVFEAFKSVEVAVRAAGKYPNTVLGVDLMRKAFHSDSGPLTDQNEPPAEREALAALFAGAIGRFKNPSSHRHVAITDPAEAVEMIQFASHLLRIVDQRK